jgi:cell migration-inducing and hyaluronan-binding protein
MPNAAIAWEQPNGFFYPPAFHSQGLFFSNVEVRHFVIDPPFKPADVLHPFFVDPNDLTGRYCVSGYDMFGGYGGGTWTGIDRQTELTDDDGSLAGLVSKQKQINNTQEVVMVNEEPFFKGPFEDYECESDINAPPLSGKGTAKDSPYEYVTTVIYPGCKETCGVYQGKDGGHDKWNKDCTSQSCYGVPLYREFQTKSENGSPARFIMMMGAAIAQRNTLTVNHGNNYYIDATFPCRIRTLPRLHCARAKPSPSRHTPTTPASKLGRSTTPSCSMRNPRPSRRTRSSSGPAWTRQ